MAWFKREKKLIEQPTPPEERRVRTEGLWVKCESCRAIVFRKDLEATLHVCPKCQFHFKMGARSRLEMLLDGRWTEHDEGMTSTDPLKFVDTKPCAAAQGGPEETRHERRHHHRGGPAQRATCGDVRDGIRLYRRHHGCRSR